MASFRLRALVSNILVYYSKEFHFRSLVLHYFWDWRLIYEVICTQPFIFKAKVYFWAFKFKRCRTTIFISFGKLIFPNSKFFKSDCLFQVFYLWEVYLFNLFICLDFCNWVLTSRTIFTAKSIECARIWSIILETL